MTAVLVLVACAPDATPGMLTAGLDASPPSTTTGPGATVPPPTAGTVRTETAPPAPQGFDLAAPLFDGDRIPELDLTLSDASVAALRADPYTYVEGALTYDGVEYAPVGVRLKGNHSFLPIDAKPSLKIKLDWVVPGQDLLGLEELTLDNMKSDPTMMRERLAYEVFREHGLPASRANHALVRIDGEDRGLYTLVESVDRDLVALWWPDSNGSLWEEADVEFSDTRVDDFELEAGPDDRTSIQAIADAMELGAQAAYEQAAAWVDWEQFVEFVAATLVVGQHDCYPWRSPGDDAHAYFDPADGRMDMLPHGLDETFNVDGYDPYSATGLLFLACMADPGCAADYDASLWDVLQTTEDMDLLGYAQDVQAQIAPLVELDPARPYPLEEVAAQQGYLLDFVATRRERLSQLVRTP